MPKGLFKIAPFVALGVMGYLVYSLLDVEAAPASGGKEPPSIPKSMLQPSLVVAQNHASPAGRDPFEVSWASYLHLDKAGATPAEPPNAAAATGLRRPPGLRRPRGPRQ